MYEAKHQRRIAVINDITGFGRCSDTVSIPILSAMKLQTCVVPTAILSMHTAYPSYEFFDFTPYMEKYIQNWKEFGLTFDGIFSGFLGSLEQIDLVESFFQDFLGEKTRIIVDPVMGDHGRIYASYTKPMCQAMKRLLPYAYVITPNLTEACELTGSSYVSLSEQWLHEDIRGVVNVARQLGKMGPKYVVLTGLSYAKEISNLVYDTQKDKYELLTTKRAGADRCGTGDIFSSVLAGAIVNGMDVVDAVKLAADFVYKASTLTQELRVDPRDGLCFEEFLGDLTKRIPTGIAGDYMHGIF